MSAAAGATPPVEFGIILGDVPVDVDPRSHLDGILRQVEAAQRHGFTYVTIGQHFLYSGYRWLQPIPLLARLAAETGPDVKLVTSVVVAPFYHPVVLAEELATLDIVCDGRLVVGIGAGYRPAEFDHLAVAHQERFARLEEALELIGLAWGSEPFDFDGRFWQLAGATPHIAPIQQPRPPLWLGALRPAGIRRAARLGDAWMVTPEMAFDEVEANRELFEAERRRHGLAPARLPLRREIVVADDRAAALRAYEQRSLERYEAYAARGQQELARDRDELAGGFGEWALARAIVGDGDDCVAQVRRIDPARFGPIITRASWPGMSNADVVAYIDAVGERVVSAFR